MMEGDEVLATDEADEVNRCLRSDVARLRCARPFQEAELGMSE